MIAYAIYSLVDLTKNSSSPFEQKVEKLQQAIDVNLIEKERLEAEEEANRQVVAYWSNYESKLPSLRAEVSTTRNAQQTANAECARVNQSYNITYEEYQAYENDVLE